MTNIDIVDRFFACWSQGNLDSSMALCTEGAVWDDVPMKRVVGQAAITAFFKFRDGKICSWSDYFDLATVERRLA